ncbi:hypothetical protein CEXT_515231 [Caerostris extrusa]|uniref:Laminin G domain-containing protein n=1 Tax=Caerostris extrusa TaxID=172846 RepID=A0AAV4NVJ1_CAEEX|nr:hypothetical protein CEXT_515231 [Caerostris extrusa]
MLVSIILVWKDQLVCLTMSMGLYANAHRRMGKLCENVTIMETEGIFVPDFGGQSYLEYPTLSNVRQAFNIEVWFLTRALHGTLLYNGQQASGKGDFIAITISDGHIDFRYDLGAPSNQCRKYPKDLCSLPPLSRKWYANIRDKQKLHNNSDKKTKAFCFPNNNRKVSQNQ